MNHHTSTSGQVTLLSILTLAWIFAGCYTQIATEGSPASRPARIPADKLKKLAIEEQDYSEGHYLELVEELGLTGLKRLLANRLQGTFIKAFQESGQVVKKENPFAVAPDSTGVDLLLEITIEELHYGGPTDLPRKALAFILMGSAGLAHAQGRQAVVVATYRMVDQVTGEVLSRFDVHGVSPLELVRRSAYEAAFADCTNRYLVMLSRTPGAF